MDIQVNIVVLSEWLTAAVFVGNLLRGPVSQLMCTLRHEGKTLSFLAVKKHWFLTVQRNNQISSFLWSCPHFLLHSFTVVRTKWEIADTALRITFPARKRWINTDWTECRKLPFWKTILFLVEWQPHLASMNGECSQNVVSHNIINTKMYTLLMEFSETV